MGGDPALIPPSGTGVLKPLPTPVTHPPHTDHYVGKIEGLIYDHFGDFAGFVLETMDGHSHRFESHEPRVEELAKRAWHDRVRVRVAVEPHHANRPASIILLI